MKLKDLLSGLSENKRNGQLSTCIRKSGLKKAGLSEKELFDLKIDTKLKKLLFEE